MTKKVADKVEEAAVGTAETTTGEVRKSDVIWNKIKNLPLEIFALADQEVHMWCKREILPEPEMVYLVLKSTAVLPALEEALGKIKPKQLKEKEFKDMAFELSQAQRFTIVKLVPKLPQ